MAYHAGRFYLFYLCVDQLPGEGIGVATSPDGVHWTDLGLALAPSAKMVRYMGSGSIWKDPNFTKTGRFISNYSEWRAEGGGQVQSIFFARSQDLLHWEKYREDAVFAIDERYYKRFEVDRFGPWDDPRWDGINVIPRRETGSLVEQGYFGYWTATPKEYQVGTRKSIGFGFGRSADGLRWQALKPPRLENSTSSPMVFVEVGGVHGIEGQIYAMLGDYATTHCGMYQFISDHPSGPFRPSPKNYCLMGNQSKMHAYFARFLEGPEGELLINHHCLAEGQLKDSNYVAYFSPLKKARLIDGALYLAWWKGNRLLKGRPVELQFVDGSLHLDPSQGIVLEGEIEMGGCLRIGCGDWLTSIHVGNKGVTEISSQYRGAPDAGQLERIDRELTFRSRLHFRLLLNQTMLEFYLSDIFIQCYTMNAPIDGTIMIDQVQNIKAWYW